MEYFRQAGNRIQASFAFHAGTLLAQYCSITATLRPEERYEATLTVCVLQSLLTNCTELLGAMKRSQRMSFNDVITDRPHRSGLTTSFITENTFPGDVTVEGVLEHLRDALSHPTVAEGLYPGTGYTTSNDPSGLVSAFCFTNSPWIKKGQIFWGALSDKEEQVRQTMERFERHRRVDGYLEVRRQADGKFGILHEGVTFLPVFAIALPLRALIDLTIFVANYLAQPTNEEWDGKAIESLVA